MEKVFVAVCRALAARRERRAERVRGMRAPCRKAESARGISGRSLSPLALLGLALFLLAAAARTPCRASEGRLDGQGAEIVEMDGPAERKTPPKVVVNEVFRVAEGDALWAEARRRATQPLEELGGRPQRVSEMMIAGFRRVKGFQSESYARTGIHRPLLFRLSAGEARKKGQAIELSKLELVYFVSSGSLMLPALSGARPDARPAHALPAALRKGRLVIRAKTGLYNTETAEGQAAGGVTLRVFSGETEANPSEALGLLRCERLSWRTWHDPATGSSEIALYVLPSGPGEADPLVRGRFTCRMPGGQETRIVLQARGMIFEASSLDHPEARRVDGQVVGVSAVPRRHVLFHRAIQMEISGSPSLALLPFQARDAGGAKARAAGSSKTAERASPSPSVHESKKTSAQEAPSRTVVRCRGPAVIDLAVLPRRITVLRPDQELALSRRFEFLNGVTMTKRPLPLPPGSPPQPAAANVTMRCGHLCIQYPPGGAQAALPEYAEALGGVRMEGTKASTPDAKGRMKTVPFRIDCWRLYYDGRADAITLEGMPGTPLEIVDEMGELATQVCSFSRKTQAFLMPSQGPKRLVLRPGAVQALAHVREPDPSPALPPGGSTKRKIGPGTLDLAGGGLEVKWYGAFSREIVRIPRPGQAPLEKEVLVLKNVEYLRQPAKGLFLRGQSIRIERDVRTGRLERITGEGAVRVRMEGMQVKGEKLAMVLAYGKDGRITRNRIVVEGAAGRSSAMLWQGQSAVRGERFVIDALRRTFHAPGGVVARVNLPIPKTAQPKPEEAKGGSALIPSIDMAPGGRLMLQCDGDLYFDGATGVLRVYKNVLVHQKNLRIVADQLRLFMDTGAPGAARKKPGGPGKPEPHPNHPAPRKGPPPSKTVPASAPGMFAGSVKIVEGLGHLEITTPTQVVHADRLFYEMLNGRLILETADPNDEVRIYMKEPSGGTQLLRVMRRLDFNGKNGVFTPGGRLLLMPFQGKVPLPRGAKLPSPPTRAHRTSGKKGRAP